MKAIQTRYLGATNTSPSRVKAWAEGGHSVTVTYGEHDAGAGNSHDVAALKLCQKLGWEGDLIRAGLPADGYVYVFADPKGFNTVRNPTVDPRRLGTLTPEERARFA